VSRDPLLFLQDIETACAKLARYTEGLSRDEVFANEMRFDAILHNAHVLGEAVKNLPESFRLAHPAIAWRKIAGMRDFVAHAYFALDLEILWSAISEDVPNLRTQVRKILQAHTEAS
jgi:uncharacterized protein with HEPN domain